MPARWILICLVAAAALPSAQPASATPLFWDSNGSTLGAGANPTGTWGSSNFWNTISTGGSGGSFTTSTTVGDDLTFSAGTDAIGSYVVTVSGAQGAHSITFEEGAVAISGGTEIILANGGGITVNSSANGTVTISTLMALGATSAAESFTFTNNNAQPLVIGGLTSVAPGTKTLTVTGTTTTTLGGAITNGAGTLALQNSGTLNLNGANTFTGGVTLTGGSLTLGSTTALGGTAGTFTIGGGTLDSSIPNLVIANNNPITINSDFVFNGSNALNLGTGAVSLGAAAGTSRQITVNLASLTLGGVISNGATATALVKAGAGTLILTGANTYNGGTTINGNGTLQLGNGTTSNGSVVGNITINTAAFSLVFANPFGQTYGGVISGTGSVRAIGAGTLNLTGVSTFSGAMTVDGGTVIVKSGGGMTQMGPLSIGTLGNNSIFTVDGASTVTQTSGSTIIGSVSTSTGTLNVGTNVSGAVFNTGTSGLTVNTNGAVNVGTFATTGTLNANGNVTLNGGSFAVNSNGAFNLAAGKTFRVQNSGDAHFNSSYVTPLNTVYIVVGTGSQLTSDVLLIGNGAQVNVSAGGSLNSPLSSVLVGTTGNGTLSVDGALSNFNAAQLAVAASGNTGTATFQTNVQASLGQVLVASDSGAGTSGTLTVQLGADVTTESVFIADQGGTSVSGVVTVTGAGSTLQQTLAGSQLTVGSSSSGAAGTLNVTSGGSYTANTGLITVSSTGTISVNGGTFNTGTNAPVGINSNGGSATTANITVAGTSGQFIMNGNGTLTIGNATAGAGTLNVNDGGVFTVGAGGSTVLDPTGTININGGIVDLKTLTNNGGTINLNSGSLSFIGSFNVGIGGPLGQNLTLDASKLLALTGTTTIDQLKTLTLSGGTLNTGTLVNNGTFLFDSGTLRITGAGGLTIGSGGALGSSFTVGPGSTLVVGNLTTVNSAATLTVNGGTVSTAGLTNSGSISTSGTFVVAAPAVNNAGATIDVAGGSFSAGAVNNSGSLALDAGTMIVPGSLTNNAGAFLYLGPNKTATVNGISTNAGEIQLGGATALLTGLGTLGNTGLIRGDGVVTNNVTNNAAGEIRAESGKRIKLTGASGANAGKINLQGGTAEFTQPLTNSGNGLIAGRGTFITAGTGLANQANVSLSSGISDVFGDVVNNTGSASKGVTISGSAAVTFWDDVTNTSGLFKVSGGSSATFFGTFGGGGISGGGQVNFEADVTPGFSPAAVTFGGSLTFDSTSTLHIDIGGTTPGSGPNNHDQVNIAGTASLGGTLDLVPFNAFVPVSGDKFVVMTFGSASGTFSTVAGTTPAPGLTYTPVYSATNLTILTTTTGEKTWAVDASGNASVGPNWTGGIAPGGVGDSATLSTIITAPRVVTLDADTTVGTLKFDSPISYALAGPHTLTLQAAGGNEATINLLNLHGNGAHTISAPITLASNLNIVQTSSGTLRLSGPVNDSTSRTITKSGSGTVEIAAQATLGGGTAINVTAGTLRFAATSGSPTIATGIQINVTGSATLELAGSTSALASSTNRAAILNNSVAAAGVLVSGTSQIIGPIDGSGITQVNSDSDLTANHIIQGALTIGGTPGSPALVLIAASDESGNPFGQSGALALKGPLPSGEFSTTPSAIGSLGTGSGGAISLTGNSLTDRPGISSIGGIAAVPEPPSTLLLTFGVVTCLAFRRRTRRWIERRSNNVGIM